MTAPATGEKRVSQAARAPIAADIFLRTLAEHGVDYLFVNPGTDFPPIVEALTRARRRNSKHPQPVLVPHENLAVAMAHGVYLVTGRAQAAMVHVNVGTGNTINNIANLSRDRGPIILAAGRTPITEQGQFGSRTRPIHWAQEMFDQAGMLREFVKWDYELRMPEQIADVTARAYEIAMTSPRGPVYVVLPREPLSAPVPDALGTPPRRLPDPPHPDPASVATLADWIAAAKWPLIVTSGDGSADAVAALSRLAERFALPVVSQNARILTLPASHPMHLGYEITPLLAAADLLVVAECDAPWFPSLERVADGCRVAHIGEDPAFQRYPMRSFPSDLSIVSRTAAAYEALAAALEARRPSMSAAIEQRRKHAADLTRARRAKREKEVRAGTGPITKAYLSHCIGEAFGQDAIIFNEYPLSIEHCPRETAGTYFALGPAGGLGWGLGAAIGAKLASPEKLVVATLGDGTYLFSNPTVCHWVQQKYETPVLTIIFNNARYGAVRRATLSMFQDGAAGEDDGRFLADLEPSPPFDAIARAQGGWAERVEAAADVPAALRRAKEAVMVEKRQALLNVICPY
jgi:acetolactate synthase-1/2/3 large subunit